MPTLYLTEEYSLVRRDSENMLLVQVPARPSKNGEKAVPARSEHIPREQGDDLLCHRL